MSNSEYYYEVHRKSYEFDSDSKLSPDNYESANENLLTDYEVVSNEEADEEDGIEVAYHQLRREKSVNAGLFKTFHQKTNDEQKNGKLQLSLSVEKISLKSQPEKIDKTRASVKTEIAQHKENVTNCGVNFARYKKTSNVSTFCPRHKRQYPHQQSERNGQKPYTPINFTIVPINVSGQRNVNERTRFEDKCNLPEIVLTSFEQQHTNQNQAEEGGAFYVANESARETCGASDCEITNVGYKVSNNREDLWQKQQLKQYRSVTSAKMSKPVLPPTPPSLPPPPVPSPSPSPTPSTTNSTKTKVKKVTRFSRAPEFTSDYNEILPEGTREKAVYKSTNALATQKTKLPDAEDTSTSEMNSQPGSSTSPESLMDNVLSAASSVSVRSSSLSSAGGSGSGGSEIRKIFSIKKNGNAMMRGTTPHVAPNLTIAKEFQQKRKELNDNRTLNLKSPILRGLSPIPPATTTTKSLSITALPPVRTTTPSTLRPISPARTLTPSPSSVRALGTPTSNANEARALQPPPPDASEASAIRSRSPSPSLSASTRRTSDNTLFPDDLKCRICGDVFCDPRTLNCLHSFCFQCLVEENFKQDSSIPFWSQPGAEEHDWKSSNKSDYTVQSSSPDISGSVYSGSSSPSRQRHSSFSFRRKKSIERILLKVRSKSDGKSSESSSPLRMSPAPEEPPRFINCKLCKYATAIPIGGIRQLPQNFLLVRKIEAVKQDLSEEILAKVYCSLCFEETNATYHCISCTLNLCTLCKEAHERQRTTADHHIRNIMELRRARKNQQTLIDDNSTKFTLKCGMHPGFEMKSFCNNCLQIVCADCLVLLHKGHRHESITKAFGNYLKLLEDAMDHTRPLVSYSELTIGRMTDITKQINKKCDDIQTQVEKFIRQYVEAIEVHRKTLLQQVHRARETKVEMVLEQQLDLEKHKNESIEALRFAEELSECGSEVEILSFLNILLKRFQYCQNFKMPVDPKISDSLHFLPHMRAPAMKAQNDIPLYGIITMQTVEPSLCTLQWEGFSDLRLHKRVELLLQSRDADGTGLCHGGLQIQTSLKYKDTNAKSLPVEIADNRDGTYGIGFTPNAEGTLVLTVNINDKPIKGSPFVFLAYNVRPHSGIYHCCTFCSSKGNKVVKCSCDGRMPGYNGCGHGHPGHPGSRHWSCCGNVLENCECTAANKTLNS